MAYVLGKGTTLSLDATLIPQVIDITPPALEMGNVDVTHLTSAARENRATIVDPGEASFTVEYDPADAAHQALWTAFQAKTIGAWQITLTDVDNYLIDFNGHIQNFGVDNLNIDSVATIPVTIKITGLPTITATP